jgi:geranylgeranyl pyrophosphate synthase
MDIYTSMLNTLLALPSINSWQELQTILKRVAAKQDPNWQLPLIACEAAGGEKAHAIPAMAAIACLQLSIILIDDMLDQDPRGEYHRLGAPATANLAAAFQAAALEVLEQKESVCGAEAVLEAIRSVNQAALMTTLGQSLDTQNPVDEVAYWKVVGVKSSPFFGAAFHVGALLGGASLEISEQLRHFGCLYGEMIQIYDDLHDTMAVPANSDWILGRSPLPILFAQVVDHPDRGRFLALRQTITDPNALTEAQTILVQCGAVSYGVYHILHRYSKARTLLNEIPLHNRRGLDVLLEEQLKPVQELFETVNMPSSIVTDLSVSTLE